ncbi:MAG: FkbM family methyltransferase, partial [Nitrososphaeraceae archaeon]|nr:FkbM family methyltransferase [Nitrososphaeraceae archaeon]
MDMSSSSVMLQLGYQPTQRVKMTTLDKFYESNPDLQKCDIIKIDVEGCEAHVLAGAVETIKKYKPKIIVEAHTFIVPGIDGIVLSFINRLGLYYKCTSVLRKSQPGPVDLRDYTFPRLFFEIE